MKSLVLALLFGCGCFGYAACGGSEPVTGSCPVKDFNGACCIRWDDCTLYSGNADQEATEVENGCHVLDPLMKPLLCLEDFNTKNLPDCLPLNDSSNNGGDGGTSSQKVEACMGTTDAWNGKEAFIYNVWCCK